MRFGALVAAGVEGTGSYGALRSRATSEGEGGAKETALLDHLEILFERSLEQDALRLLQGLSHSRTVVVVWSGVLEGGSLIYAVPGHPEHRCYVARS